MKTKTVTLYEFDELSEDAKEKAREWMRDGALDYEWWDGIYEDANQIGLKITGFDLDRSRHAEGNFIDSAIEVADKIIKEHGETCETRKDAEAFLKQRDEIVEHAERDENGELVSEYDLDQKLDEVEKEFQRTILEDYSIMLQKEYEYRLADEAIDEDIRANEYTFTADGKRED